MEESTGFDLDTPGFQAWLLEQQLTDDASTPLESELLTGGRSNVTYRVSQGEREWVVRRPPFGHVMPSAHDMGREFTVLSGLRGGGFRVPQPYAFCDDARVIGAPFLVMEFVAGSVYAHRWQTEGLAVEQTSTLSEQLVSVLADLHAVNADAVGLGDFGRPQGFLQRQVRRWQQQWELSQTRDFALMAEFATRLHSQVGEMPTETDWSIIHGDYRLDNTIVDPETFRIRAVVDWEMSTLGHPMSDLALLLVYWTQPNDGLRKNVPLTDGVTDAAGFVSREQIVGMYVERSGRSVDDLDVCIALSCFKLAVILESIRKRMIAGQQVGGSTTEADELLLATDALIEIGNLSLTTGGMQALSS
ncbi:MAG: phosphotransferase family protein [Candidatus Nanopelagicales bacterium]